jgi:CBS-domain-containing membrane protein
MELLKRVLYTQAALWALVGLALAFLPGFVLRTVFSQSPLADDAWARIVGVQLVGTALFSILVGQNVEDRWWWSWAFAIVNAGVATIAVLRAVFPPGGAVGWTGLAPQSSVYSRVSGSSTLLWWLIATVEAVLTGFLLWGLARAGTEQPPDIGPSDN